MEFIPSAWDSQAAPVKSALRSPDKTSKCERKGRNVWFKKQKYHCVYEYPRGPDLSPPEWTQPTGSGIWGTPTAADLSSFAEWELDTENVLDDGAHILGPESEMEDDSPARYTRRDYYRRPGDLYRLANVAPPDIDFATGSSVTDDDFYVTSSSRPFQSYGLSSQFFPGQLQFTSTDSLQTSKYQMISTERANSIIDFANDLKKLHSANLCSEKNKCDQTTPDSGVEDITTPASIDHVDFGEPKSKYMVASLKALATNALNATKYDKDVSKSQEVMGGLRHTRDRLKLDLPPSPSSFTANKSFSLEITTDTNSHQREVPTFTTFGKTRFSIKHVDTPTEELETVSSKIVIPSIADINSSSTESTSNETNSPDVMDLSQPSECDSAAESLVESGKRRSIEIVRGEASLLDSADEDSGIESSANATLEREAVIPICNDNKV